MDVWVLDSGGSLMRLSCQLCSMALLPIRLAELSSWKGIMLAIYKRATLDEVGGERKVSAGEDQLARMQSGPRCLYFVTRLRS